MESMNDPVKLSGDAWLELQAFKNRQLNRREKLNRHKDLINGLGQLTDPTRIRPTYSVDQQTNANHNQNNAHLASHQSTSSTSSLSLQNSSTNSLNQQSIQHSELHENKPTTLDGIESSELIGIQKTSSNQNYLSQIENPNIVECILILKLCDVALKLPVNSRVLHKFICKIKGLERTSQSLVNNLLQKFVHQELISIEEPSAALLSRRAKSQPFEDDDDEELCTYVTSADHTKLVELEKSYISSESIRALLAESRTSDIDADGGKDGDNLESSSSQNISQLSNVPIQTVKRVNDSLNVLPDRCDKSSYQPNRLSQNIDRFKDRVDGLSNSSSRGNAKSINKNNSRGGDEVESLLSLTSTKEKESKKLGEELLELLSKPTAKEKTLMERFRSADGYQVQEFCPKGTKGECNRHNNGAGPCDKLHFKKIIAKHTEESLGDCSFLNTCFHMDSCKYVHYEVDYDDDTTPANKFKKPKLIQSGKTVALNSNSAQQTTSMNNSRFKTTGPSTTKDSNNNSNSNLSQKGNESTSALTDDDNSYFDLDAQLARVEPCDHARRFKTVLYPPQWIQCDLRFFDMSLLGKFSVVMADPPWDIHMELPYGTMSDDEMRKLNIPALQDEGVIFLWVTGRAMELGRECLALWGYERCDEVIWVKTNQLQRIIRTGRTGHWLNHGKEHCLVGVKGNPKDINRGLDCDVIVAEVRATSHKPDEIYGIIERLSPGTRKIELFGRPHNVQPNWITLGNQLNGVKLMDPDLVEAFKRLNLPYQSDGPLR